MVAKMAKASGFLLFLSLTLALIANVLQFKDNPEGIEAMRRLYDQPAESIDVLVLGSSRAFENINPAFLWDQYGIAAYDLCGTMQPYWNTYYYLNEALKTQKPKLIVLEVYRSLMDSDFTPESRSITNTFGIADPFVKAEAKSITVPNEECLEYFLEFPLFHSRYSDLSRKDFLPYMGIKDREAYKGFLFNFTTERLDSNPDVSNVFERKPMSKKTETYFYKIIETAKSHDIPLALICAPYDLSDKDQCIYNTVADIAENNDIPFLNYNLMFNEVGFDFASDNSDLTTDNHLNHRGSAKLTKHLGGWIKENYDIPDRRGDSKYLSWTTAANNSKNRIKDQFLREVHSFSNWIAKVSSSKHYTTAVSIGNKTGDLDEGIIDMFKKLGIANGNDIHGCYVLRGSNLIYNSHDGDNEWHTKLYDAEIMLDSSDPSNTVFYLGYDRYVLNENLLSFLVYDNKTGELVEVVSWSPQSLNDKSTISPETKT